MSTRPHDLVVTKWGARFLGCEIPCAIGRGGIGQKAGEGDGITPCGTFELLEIWIRPDRIDLGGVWPVLRPITPQSIWSDDPYDPKYNQPKIGRWDGFSHESLRRPDPLYDIFGVIDFNYPEAEPGAGSAIFLHVWRKPRHPTEGCVAFDRRDLAWIFANWTPTSRVQIRA